MRRAPPEGSSAGEVHQTKRVHRIGRYDTFWGLSQKANGRLRCTTTHLYVRIGWQDVHDSNRMHMTTLQKNTHRTCAVASHSSARKVSPLRHIVREIAIGFLTSPWEQTWLTKENMPQYMSTSVVSSLWMSLRDQYSHRSNLQTFFGGVDAIPVMLDLEMSYLVRTFARRFTWNPTAMKLLILSPQNDRSTPVGPS